MFQEETRKYTQEGPRNPKAYQLKIGRYSTEDSMYKQDDTDVNESKDSFSLQMQIKKPQADQGSCETQHLATNLKYKVKAHGKKIKFLTARIDTCSNENVMLYKILHNDPNCTKLLPRKRNGIKFIPNSNRIL